MDSSPPMVHIYIYIYIYIYIICEKYIVKTRDASQTFVESELNVGQSLYNKHINLSIKMTKLFGGDLYIMYVFNQHLLQKQDMT